MARALWAEQVQCARLQVSTPPWPVPYLFNGQGTWGQGTWPLVQTRDMAGLGLDAALEFVPIQIAIWPACEPHCTMHSER